MDLSSHYLLELERLWAPYRIIWTRDEGCVDRPIITPKKRRSKHVSAMKLPDPDAFTDSFRARCASLPPLLPPQTPSLPRSTYQMSHSEWLAILDDKHPVVHLAHSLCLPRGLTTILAGILIFGLKPVRAFLFCFTSLPKPGKTNSPYFLISL